MKYTRADLVERVRTAQSAWEAAETSRDADDTAELPEAMALWQAQRALADYDREE